MTNTTNSVFNVAIGTRALKNAITPSYCTAVGFEAAGSASGVSLSRLTAIGARALQYSQGSFNVAIGMNAMQNNGTGSYNVAVGDETLGGIEVSNHVALGYRAFWNLSSFCSGSIAIGSESANYQADGSTLLINSQYSVYIGTQVRAFNNSDVNSIVIGANAIGQGANTTVIGNTNTVSGTIFGSINFPLGVRVSTLSGVLQASISSGGVIFGTLASGVVISGSVASGQIGTFHLASGVLAGSTLGSGQVTSGIIASGSVGQFKLSSGAVNSGHIGNAAVVSGSVASGQIGIFHLASGTLQGAAANLQSGQVTSGFLGDQSVASGSIASGQIGGIHVRSGSLSNNALTNSSITIAS